MAMALKQEKAFNEIYISLYIGTVKFSNLFKESPCSPVVTFPSFGSEGHGVQPPQGDSYFPYLCLTSPMLFCKVFCF